MTQQNYDMSIHSNPDAQAWAKFFIATQRNTGFTIDEELMTGWFANAMMAMYDHAMGNPPLNGDHAEWMAAQAQATEVTMDDAIAAGSGCLHSTIDRLQDEVARQKVCILGLCAQVQTLVAEKIVLQDKLRVYQGALIGKEST